MRMLPSSEMHAVDGEGRGGGRVGGRSSASDQQTKRLLSAMWCMCKTVELGTC